MHFYCTVCWGCFSETDHYPPRREHDLDIASSHCSQPLGELSGEGLFTRDSCMILMSPGFFFFCQVWNQAVHPLPTCLNQLPDLVCLPLFSWWSTNQNWDEGEQGSSIIGGWSRRGRGKQETQCNPLAAAADSRARHRDEGSHLCIIPASAFLTLHVAHVKSPRKTLA